MFSRRLKGLANRAKIAQIKLIFMAQEPDTMSYLPQTSCTCMHRHIYD